MSDEPPVLIERDGNHATITLNRPDARNPLSWPVVHGITDVLDELVEDDNVRGVILTGAGKAFCAGGDIKFMAERQSWPVTKRVTRQVPITERLKAIWNFPKPLIAAVNGVAAGAGAGLALMADMRICSDAAKFGFPFPRVGLGPDYGVSWTLPRTVGHGTAARLIYTGATIDANEAKAIGLADEVVDAGTEIDRAKAIVDEIAAMSPYGVFLAKQGLRRSGAITFESAIDQEFAVQHLAMTTEDHKEATKAFSEKRAPNFENK